MTIGAQIRYGLGQFRRGIVNAQPPGKRKTYPSSTFSRLSGIGSNGVALGRKVTASGRGMLLGNPHYPWRGPSRFHLIHTTIPGELDVMGVSLMTTTRILIGFNKDIAWTHTVSAALRSNVYELTLNPDNPLQYLFENEYRDIETLNVEVEIFGSDSHLRKESHKVYSTHLGPLLVSKEFPWTRERAYAIRDANLYNNRHDETYDALHKAKDVDEIERALSRQGVALANTIAADRHGTAFYADISVTPNIDGQQLAACRMQLPGVPAYFVVMDGSRRTCEWKSDDRARIPDAMPADDMPRLRRDDYVTNSNDSYWLSNPAEPLEGFSPTIGNAHTQRSLRTRAGIVFVEELVDPGNVYPADLQKMLYSNRNYAAELLLDDVLQVCTSTATAIYRACQALEAWDRTMNLDSRGSQVWTEFWTLFGREKNIYATAYDDQDPAHTPRGIALSKSEVKAAVIKALTTAQVTLDAAEIGLDQPLGEIQYSIAPDGEAIPIPGGSGRVGMFSIASAALKKGSGYTPISGGNSFIQVVSWDEAGNLDARGVLTYSQSQEADSMHNSDFTRLYSEGGWLKLPFTDTEIDADVELRILHLAE
jgi:acyl-homoserine-lactone acylase